MIGESGQKLRAFSIRPTNKAHTKKVEPHYVYQKCCGTVLLWPNTAKHGKQEY